MFNLSRSYWLLLALAMPLSACGSEADANTNDAIEEEECDSSTLRYDNFGSSFMEDYCQSCHSSSAENRRGAPSFVNLDTLQEVKDLSARIIARSGTGTSMPPPSAQAMPSSDARSLLVEWIECGAR